MYTTVLILVSLALAGTTESRNPHRAADDVTLVSEPHRRQDGHRITGRSSANLFTPANAGLVIPYAPGDSTYGYMALSLAALGPRSLAGNSNHLKQPLKPIYHATPLQPYGLDTSKNVFASKSYVKPIVEKQQEGPFNKYSSGGSVGHLTQAILHKPVVVRQAPVAYQSHSLGHSLDHSSEYKHVQEEDHYAAKYQFGYQVRDPKGGNFFGHSEARDGDSTKGQYHVFLPDGRLQHVQYWADPSGYHAEISYNRPATQHHNTHV